MNKTLISVLVFLSIIVARLPTLAANTTAPAGTPGYALFSSTNDTILVSGNTVVTNTMTIEAEFLFPSSLLSNPPQTFGLIYEEQRGGNEDKQLGVSSNTMYGTAWTTNHNGIDDPGIPTTTQNLTRDVWHHVAFVRDQNEQRLYLDGTLAATRDLTGTVYDLPIGNFPGSSRSIGAFFDGHGLRLGFQGGLEWIRVSGTARYSGTTASRPAIVPSTDSDTLLLFDFGNVAPGSATVYDLSGGGFVGTAGVGFAGATAPVFVQAGAPVVLSQPLSQTVMAGSSVTLIVAVSGTGPFTYQWFFNGTNIPNDNITTVAGNGGAGYSGDGGAATSSCLWSPLGVAVDASGNLFIADTDNYRIRKVDGNGIITTVAGYGSEYYDGDGGDAIYADLDYPTGIAVDRSGNVFIADTDDQRIRKVDANGIITTVAGKATATGPHDTYYPGSYFGDGGTATNAGINNPFGVAVDASGNLFIADTDNYRIRKVDGNGIITTVAGNGYADQYGSGAYSGDGGGATNASLWNPLGVAVDAHGSLFIADQFNQRIRKVSADGTITTVAGNGSVGYSGDGGAATNASLNYPSGVAVDGFGNLFIADGYNRIRKVNANGIITSVAGNGYIGPNGGGYSGDGGGATNASLWYPFGVAVDAHGNLFIADTGNSRIRKVPLAGMPTLVLNNVSSDGAGDYQVVVTSPSGSVTSAVARLSVADPLIQMNVPLRDGLKLVLGFSPVLATNSLFTLLQSSNITGLWSTNTSAVLTTNTQAGGYEFTIPAPNGVQFYRIRSH